MIDAESSSVDVVISNSSAIKKPRQNCRGLILNFEFGILKRPLHLTRLIRLNHITNVNVVEVLDADTAIEA